MVMLLTEGADTYRNTRSNVTIAALGGADRVTNSGANVSVDGGAGNDYLYNSGNYTTLNGGEGADTVYNNYVDYVSVNGGVGNDSINNYSAWYSTVNAGDGADTVVVSYRAYQDSISGGAGNDKISLASGTGNGYYGNNTIHGGTGSDTIYGNASATIGNMYQYTSGDGNDLMYYFNAKDTLKIGNGTTDTYSKETVGANVLVTVGSGVITLSGASSLATLNILGTEVTNKITLTEGADTYSNTRANVTIAALGGADRVTNSGANVSVDGGAGNNYVYNTGRYSTILGGNDADTLYNNDGDYSSIDLGSGNDSIYAYNNDYVTVNAGAGNDKISGTYCGSKINGEEGDDSISGTYYGSKINGEEGDDSISGSFYWNSSIAGGAGNDTINVTYGNASVDGGAGNDRISLGTSDTYYAKTIKGGTGNDTIYGNSSATIGNMYQYTSGDGNDLMYYFNAKDTLKIGNGTTDTYSKETVGSNVLVTVGSGVITLSGASSLATLNILGTEVTNKITLTEGADTYSNTRSNVTIAALGGADRVTNSGANVSIDGGTGNDYLYNSGNYTTLNGGEGADTVYNNYVDYVSVNGGAGNDSINNYSAFSSTIDGGAGNDTILVPYRAYQDSISGGAGNDKISLASGTGNGYYGNNTIHGGTGDDTIYGNASATIGNMYQYTSGDGNDLMYYFNAKDTLKIGNGTTDTYSKETVGANVLVTVGSGVITLSGASSLATLNIAGTEVDTKFHFTEGNDTYNNTVSGVTLAALGGADRVTNSGASVSLDGGAGNDYLYNSGRYSTILGGDGADTISNYGVGGVKIDGGAGNDSIESYNNWYNTTSISGGNGDDTIFVGNNRENSYTATVNGGAGNDRISLGSDATKSLIEYKSGDGNDSITGFTTKSTLKIGNGTTDTYSKETVGANVLITVGSGVITLSGASSLATLNIAGTEVVTTTTEGEYINNTVSGTLITATNYDDTIENYGSTVTINALGGHDSIYNEGENVSIVGGTGNDSIYNWNSKVTVNGGAGEDLVENYVESVVVDTGADNDTIYNYRGTFITLKSGSGNDTIHNSFATRISMDGGDGNDSIYGNNDYATVSAGAGNDTITGNHWRSKLSGDEDDDLISITSYWYNTLSGGDGNDTIIAKGNEHSVSGGAGADKISLSGDNVTVSGGTGDDTIYGNTKNTHLYQYAKGDGNDIIYNWSSNDTLTITGGSGEKSTVGNNVLVNVAGSGVITLVGAKDKTVNVYPTSEPSPTLETAVSQQEVIKKFMKSLDTTTYSGVAALNQAVSVASGGYFKDVSSAINKMVEDCSVTGNATTFLKDYCGIDLNNTDTGAITGSDAGGSTVKTKNSIVPEEGSLNNFTENSFKTNGLTVQLASFSGWNKPTELSYSSLTDDKQKYIWQAFNTWWASGALNLVADSYGNNFGFDFNSSATVKKLYFGFDYEKSGMMAVTTAWYADSTHKTFDTLGMQVNMYNYSTIDTSSPDGKISNKEGFMLDRVLAHEFTHAVMFANVNYSGDLPNFISEGMAELTHGTDDDRKSEITKLANNPSSLKNALSVDCYDSYAGGYMFLRYLAKQASEHYPTSSGYANVAASRSVSGTTGESSSVSISGSLLTILKDFAEDMLDLTTYASTIKNVDATELTRGIMIVGNKNANSISAGAGNDSLFGNTGNDTILGGDGDDYISGDAGDDKLYGNAGNDTIAGGTGTDSLTGGEGKNVFVHVADNDVIIDYTEGSDKIKLAEEHASVTSSSLKGNDVVLTVGLGTITVKDGKGKNLTIVDYDGKETSSVYGTSDTEEFDNSSAAKVTLPSGILIGDASSRTKAIRIVGNALDNSILGGTGKDTLYGKDGNDYLAGNAGADKLYGQNGNDTLWGGTGNDTLEGGAGADLFIYTEGKDVITDYTASDKISVSADVTASSIKGSDATFTIGGNTLTVKNGKGAEIVFIDADANERTIIGGAYLANDSSNAKSTLASWREVGDATERTKAIRLVGNALDNSILGGSGKDTLYGKDGNDSLVGNAGADKLYGQNGNDTLWGGIGNDTLEGGDGADTFIYNNGEGKDVITDFGNDDLLKIMGTFSGTYNESKNTIAFKVGTTASAITLKNFTATTFNINNDDYEISGKKLVKK